jgi:hypothetical protein
MGFPVAAALTHFKVQTKGVPAKTKDARGCSQRFDQETTREWLHSMPDMLV